MVKGRVGYEAIHGTRERRAVVLEVGVVDPRHPGLALFVDERVGRPLEPLEVIIQDERHAAPNRFIIRLERQEVALLITLWFGDDHQ